MELEAENVKNIRSLALCKEKLKVQTSIAEEMEKMSGTYHTSYAEAIKDLYEKNKAIRRQKYKRCLAIARWCFTKSNYHFVVGRSEVGKTGMTHYRISRLYSKWYNRWLKLAEKFKEAV